MQRTVVLVLLVLAFGGRAVAGEGLGGLPAPASEKEAAAAVLAAVEVGDDAALAALVVKDGVDLWGVADRLSAQGEGKAAGVFAKAHPSPASARLGAYVATWKGLAEDPDADQVLAAVQQDAWEEVIRRTGSPDARRSPVAQARLLAARGHALRRLNRLPESVAAFEAAAESALAIGWLDMALPSLAAGAESASLLGQYPRAAEITRRRLAAAREGGSLEPIVNALTQLGLSLSQSGRSAEAVPPLEEALSLARDAGRPRLEMEVLTGLANVRYDQSNFRETLALQQRALVITEDLGLEAQRTILLGNMGNTYHSLGEFEKAVTLHTQALERFRASGDRTGVPRTLFNLGRSQAAQGDHATAERCFREAIPMAEALGHLPMCAFLFYNLALSHRNRDQLPRALEAIERERAVRQAMGDLPGLVRTLSDAGNLHFDMERYAEALAVQKRGLELAEAQGLGWATAILLGNMGNTLQNLGDYEEAARVQEKALALYRAAGDRQGIARTLLNLGNVHQEQGRFAAALAVQEEALALTEAMGASPMLARLLMNLGNTYASLGESEQAQEVQERALALFVKMGHRADEAQALLNIANRHYEREEHEEALAAEQRAFALAEALGLREMQALLLGHMANSFRALDRETEGMEHMTRALELFRELGNRERIGWALGNLGLYHRTRGEYEKAIACLEEALVEAEALGLTPDVTQVLRSTAHTHLQAGNPAAAVRATRRACALLFDLFGGLADEQGASARATFSDVFDVGIQASVALDDPVEVSWFMETGRAGSLLEALENREGIRDAAIPAALREEEAAARAAEAAAVIAHRKAVETGLRKAIFARRKELESAQGRVARVVGRIQRKAKRVAGVLKPESESLDRIQSRLGPDEALVLYALLPDEATALVVTGDAARIVPLPAPATIRAALESFQPADAEAPADEAVTGLRALLIEPLRLPETVSCLLVSPDGCLGYVPFALLVPDREVTCVPSGTTYGVLLAERDLRGETVLALGDPDYQTNVDTEAASRLRGGLSLVPLPATRAEAMAVGDVQLLGAYATEAHLRDRLRTRERWRAVHLACHGLVDTERPGFSSLAVTRAGGDDGFLTANEVFQMEVKADLVVLSACETGRGKVLRSEGIIGLTRAFMFAGAPRVLVSLWKVDDDATRALMEKFYELWNPDEGEGLGAAAALEKAQAFVRSHEKWRHPCYWAAWVLWGLRT